MADAQEGDCQLADLFETITGQSTIVERQEGTEERRLDEDGEERSIRRYVSAASAATGLDDAIEVPESR